MSLLLFLVFSLFTLALLPAFAVQFALGRWFRDIERVPPDEVWAQRYDEQILAVPGSNPVHQSEGLFRD